MPVVIANKIRYAIRYGNKCIPLYTLILNLIIIMYNKNKINGVIKPYIVYFPVSNLLFVNKYRYIMNGSQCPQISPRMTFVNDLSGQLFHNPLIHTRYSAIKNHGITCKQSP